MEIRILFNGVYHYYEKEGITFIDDITSSVTLLKTEKENILIDSGSPIYEKKLLSTLEENSVKPEDINWIIETHLHPDHVGNNHFFKNAKLVEGNWVLDFKNKLYTGFKKNSDVPLPKEIEIINTPGHTLPHFSVVIEKNNKKIVWAGDAIRKEMLNDDYSPAGEDIPKMIESALKICEIADEIILGHGPNLEKDDISKIKNNLLKNKEKGGVA